MSWFKNLQRGDKHDLSYLLSSADAKKTLDEKVLWLEHLVEWVRDENQTTRLKFLLQVLDRNPAWKMSSSELILSILAETQSVRLFSETGVPSWNSVISEFFSRLLKVVLSGSMEGSKQLKGVLEQVFYDEDDEEWLSAVPTQLREDLFSWIMMGSSSLPPNFKDRMILELIDANLILAMKSAAITVREDFATRSPEYRNLSMHPLLRLELCFLELSEPGFSLESLPPILEKIHHELDEVELIGIHIKKHMETHGVSMDLVFQRDRLKLYGLRMRILLKFLAALKMNDEKSKVIAYDLFLVLVQGNQFDRDFFYLLKKNFSFMSKKIVDFTSHTGETYIAQNRADYSHLFWYAAGGGALTAFTVMIKYAFEQKGWPLFVEAYYAFLNYSFSFLLMHFLHFKLATKQPSMTAAALASKLKHNNDSLGDDEFVQEIAKITRSQFASVLGNLAAVIPVAIVMDLIWVQVHGHHYFNPGQAEHVLESIHPWQTLTVLYAAMTGVLLWLSGLTSGWVENGAVFYHVPELIRSNKLLKRILGIERTKKVSNSFLKNISGITSSVSLGFYLAIWPVVGKFFGLPFDIRHITLTTGSVAMAVNSLGVESISLIQWIEVGVGIVLIGTMNFGVSFLLALLVAMRAKELNIRQIFGLFKKAFLKWLRSPLQFLFPIKDV